MGQTHQACELVVEPDSRSWKAARLANNICNAFDELEKLENNAIYAPLTMARLKRTIQEDGQSLRDLYPEFTHDEYMRRMRLAFRIAANLLDSWES